MIIASSKHNRSGHADYSISKLRGESADEFITIQKALHVKPLERCACNHCWCWHAHTRYLLRLEACSCSSSMSQRTSCTLAAPTVRLIDLFLVSIRCCRTCVIASCTTGMTSSRNSTPETMTPLHIPNSTAYTIIVLFVCLHTARVLLYSSLYLWVHILNIGTCADAKVP